MRTFAFLGLTVALSVLLGCRLGRCPSQAPCGEVGVPKRITLVTYNIGNSAPKKYGVQKPFNLPGAGALLKRLKADFVALQEVDKFVGRGGNPSRDTAGDLAKEAGFPYALFGKAIPLRRGAYGVALLCREKPTTWEVVKYPPSREQRVFIDARFRMVDGKTLAVICTHFDLSAAARTAQVEALLAHLKAKPADRVLLAGDLNASVGDNELKPLFEGMSVLTPCLESFSCSVSARPLTMSLPAPSPANGGWRFPPPAAWSMGSRRRFPTISPCLLRSS